MPEKQVHFAGKCWCGETHEGAELPPAQLTLYAIRHDPSGYFLPARKNGRGYSHDEPQSHAEVMPRLFFKEIEARRALTAWLQGIFSVRAGGPDQYGGDEPWLDVEEKPGRKREEMSIVTVKGEIL